MWGVIHLLCTICIDKQGKGGIIDSRNNSLRKQDVYALTISFFLGFRQKIDGAHERVFYEEVFDGRSHHRCDDDDGSWPAGSLGSRKSSGGRGLPSCGRGW